MVSGKAGANEAQFVTFWRELENIFEFDDIEDEDEDVEEASSAVGGRKVETAGARSAGSLQGAALQAWTEASDG